MTGSAFVSLVCVCEGTPDIELREFSAALAAKFPLHEIVAGARRLQTSPSLPNLHVIELSPPADDRMRLAAALDHALGDIVVIVDPERDDPHAAVQAAALVAAGAAAVYEVPSNGRRTRRWVYDATRNTLSRAAGVPVPPVDGVRACNREVLSTLLDHPDRDRLTEAFPSVSGHEWQPLPMETDASPVHRPLRWHISALLAASARPLRLAYLAAVAGAVLNLLYSGYIVAVNLFRGETVEGWTTLSLQLTGMFLLISVILAILAEYVFQVVKRGQHRPLYRVSEDVSSPSVPVREELNVEHEHAAHGPSA